MAAIFFARNKDTMPPGASIQHHKLRGEWAELRFMARATEHGLAIAKPWGEMSRYDFAIEHHGHFHRVQVKCTINQRRHSYTCNVSSNGVPYAPNQLDFIAAYVIAKDVWYIIPAAATGTQRHILLSPHLPNSKYEKYKEAWHLFAHAK
jgi:hypothetical protein